MPSRSLPVVGDLLTFQADRLGFVTAVQREHGDVARFRLGPYPVWQLSHPDHVRSVLVSDAARFRKGMVLQRARVVLGDGLLTAEGDVHRQHRVVVQPAFHSRRVDGYARVMAERAAVTSTSWRPGEPVDVHAATVRMTLETAGATLLGTDLDADVATVEAALADLLSAYKLAFLPFSERLQGLPVGPLRRLRRGRTSLHDLVDRMLADRERSGEDGGDLLSALLLGSGNGAGDGVTGGSPVARSAVRDHAVTLLLAGHETTANTLAFALHLLAHHPAVQARVHAEVDAAAGDEPPDLDRFPLCRAVVSEALRLYPPSWMMGRQAIADHEVDGQVIAAGDLVVLPQWVVHHDHRWWPRPYAFEPDRWLGDGDPGRPRWAFFPFGAGLRRCIGEGFAWTEAVLGLVTIARRWRLRPVPDRPLRLDPLITLRPRRGLWLIPDPR
ncbi:cytochrome P450 [Jiangella asiatica]|uniref:Cytochrome P450 n=1 Tax=Jiangella asiatica TaxID=2530372 RepID=A0A4R5CPP8_9ACTN|nr:cytochrome P450 [Jiangella asiatica]TDE02432.1 cytochrome P450 [Jiangella asiatica]